jgi:hypothetical protein
MKTYCVTPADEESKATVLCDDEVEQRLHRHEMAAAFAVGYREGREGEEGPLLRQRVRDSCERLGLEINGRQRQQIGEFDLDELSELIQSLEVEGKWLDTTTFRTGLWHSDYDAQIRLDELVHSGLFPPTVPVPDLVLSSETGIRRMAKQREHAQLVRKSLLNAAREMGRNEARAKWFSTPPSPSSTTPSMLFVVTSFILP